MPPCFCFMVSWVLRTNNPSTTNCGLWVLKYGGRPMVAPTIYIIKRYFKVINADIVPRLPFVAR